MGVQIMSVDWVHKCWESREDTTVSAGDTELVSYLRKIVVTYCNYKDESSSAVVTGDIL